MNKSKESKDNSGIDYQDLISRVDDKTEKKINEIFNESRVNSWLQGNQGSTYARILFELKPIAERRFWSEYLKQELENRVGILLSEKTKLRDRIGDLSGVLKPWEGGDFFWLANPISLLIEWSLKAGLAVIPIISLILILDTRELSKILEEPNFFTYIAIFAGVGLVWLISASTYNWVVSISSSRVIQNYWSRFKLTRRRTKNNNKDQTYLRKSYFLGVSQFSVLLIVICVIEASIGWSIISHIVELQKYQLQLEQVNVNRDDIIKKINDLKPTSGSLFLSASIFALTNLVFSVSKANRYNQIKKIKRKLEATIKKLRHLDLEIKHCKMEVQKVKKDFKNNKKEYDELLNRDESGILKEIRRLSNQAYVNPPQPITTYRVIESLLKGDEQTKDENFNQNGFNEQRSKVPPDPE